MNGINFVALENLRVVDCADIKNLVDVDDLFVQQQGHCVDFKYRARLVSGADGLVTEHFVGVVIEKVGVVLRQTDKGEQGAGARIH